MASPIYSCERRITMKVVYRTCCGVDVHKSFLVATIIRTTDGVQPSYRKERFSTFKGDIRILLVRSHMEFVEKELRTLDAKLDELIAPYENAISLLCTIPGADRASAITILS